MKKTLLLFSFLFLSHVIFAQYWTASGNNIYNSLPGYVGIGTGPSYPLDVAGVVHTTGAFISDAQTSGAISTWVRGINNVNANLVIQSANKQAWWLTGANGYLKIGANGGTEPATGVINVDETGHVGINTLNTTGYTFNVNGSAVFDAVTVTAFSSTNPKSTPWADYVFSKNYQLPSLDSIAAYIKANGHLPGIPSAAEVEKNGVDLGTNQARLLEKIEQLTLYVMDLKKENEEIRTQLKKLSRKAR
jgi:hypothetical protein